ncbi:MAG: hypothetical protein AB1416_11325 [Actinomycetota bacterium]
MAWLVRAGTTPAERRAMAKALGVCERSLREWGRRLEVRRLGRPRTRREKIRAAIRTLRSAWRAMTAGMSPSSSGPGVPRLMVRCPGMSRYLAEKFVASRKRAAGRRRRRKEAALERSVEIREPGVVVTLDGIATGWQSRRRIEGHIFRDRGSTKFLEKMVGVGIDSRALTPKILKVLDDSGAYVLQIDGDKRHQASALKRALRKRRVMHYLSEPRTPQHNPVAEEGMREIRQFLPEGGATSVEEATSSIDRAFLTLNREWLRPSRGGLSSEALYALPRVEINREAMYRQFVIFKRRFRREMGRTLRARRRANRRAVEATLVAFGLATVKIGGVPLGPDVGRN